jgi:hypothetical protein
MEEVDAPDHFKKRDLLLEINPCKGTVRINLLDEEDNYSVTPDTLNVETLANVQRYQCFTFPEESNYDLKIDRISMKKTPRDSSPEGRRFDQSDEVCELGPQIYTLKITTDSEQWGVADNVQATIVFSGNTAEVEGVSEDDSAAEDDLDEAEDEAFSYDFRVEETDEFLLHNLKHIGKVECIFVTKATDEIWRFHEIRVTRVKGKEKAGVSTEEALY